MIGFKKMIDLPVPVLLFLLFECEQSFAKNSVKNLKPFRCLIRLNLFGDIVYYPLRG